MTVKDKERREELRQKLAESFGGMRQDHRRAMHAAALVHGFAILAFVVLFWLSVSTRARLAVIEGRVSPNPDGSLTIK